MTLLHEGKSILRKRVRERLRSISAKVVSTVALILSAGGFGYLLARKPAPATPVAPQRLLVDNAAYWRSTWSARQFDFSSTAGSIRLVFASEKGLPVWDEKTGVNRRLNLRGHDGWQAGLPPATLPRWAPDGQHFIFQAFKQVDGLEIQPMETWSFFLVNALTEEARRISPGLPRRERARDLAWLADGKSVTYLSHENRFYTLDLATGQHTSWMDTNLPRLREPLLGEYSPDGRWLPISVANGPRATRDERAVWLLQHSGGRAVPLTDGVGLNAFPTWAPDGETIYYVSSGDQRSSNTWGIWKVRVDPRTGLRQGPGIEVFTKKAQQLLYPKLLSSGRRLAFAGAEPNTHIWTAAEEQLDRGAEVIRGRSPVLSPDGTTVYYAGETPEQQGIYPAPRSGAALPRKISDFAPVTNPFCNTELSLSPDGELIALCSDEGQKLGVCLLPTAGGTARRVVDLTAWEAILPVWSPDGQWLAFTVGKVLYRISRDGQTREPLATLERWQGWTLRWSPDGKWIAALAYETEQSAGNLAVVVVSVTDMQSRRLTPESEHQYKEGLEWHPDAQRLTYHLAGPGKFDAKIKWAFLNEPGRTEEMIDQVEHWDYVGVWAPDGRRFYFDSSFLPAPGSARAGTAEKSIHVYDRLTGQITHGLRDGSLPSWSQDGRIAVWTTSQTSRYFEVLEDFH